MRIESFPIILVLMMAIVVPLRHLANNIGRSRDREVQWHRDIRGKQVYKAVINNRRDIKLNRLVLLLRPFDTLGKVAMTSAPGFSFFNPFENEVDFEERLANALSDSCELVAVGYQNSSIGAAKAYTSHNEWQKHVEIFMTKSHTVILIAGHQEGTLWELSRLIENNMLYKTFIIYPSDIQGVDMNTYTRMTKKAFENIGIHPPHSDWNNTICNYSDDDKSLNTVYHMPKYSKDDTKLELLVTELFRNDGEITINNTRLYSVALFLSACISGANLKLLLSEDLMIPHVAVYAVLAIPLLLVIFYLIKFKSTIFQIALAIGLFSFFMLEYFTETGANRLFGVIDLFQDYCSNSHFCITEGVIFFVYLLLFRHKKFVSRKPLEAQDGLSNI